MTHRKAKSFSNSQRVELEKGHKGVASYDEALQILSELARGGDVRAAVALAGHLAKFGASDPVEAEVAELAKRRLAKGISARATSVREQEGRR